jgi:nitroreductase
MHNINSPYNINISDFFELDSEQARLEFILRYAVLAPSAHNSQPWRFKIVDNNIYIYLVNERRLNISDKIDRQAFISIGCVLKTILLVAEVLGYKTATTYFTNYPEDFLVGKINLNRFEKFKFDNIDVLNYLLKRRTNRGKYEPIPIQSDFKQMVDTLNTDSIKIKFVSDLEVKTSISDIVVDSMIDMMDSKDFREELSNFVKNNLTKDKIGIPASAMGIRTLVSFFIPTMIKFINLSRYSKKQDLRLLKDYTPAFIIIESKSDNPETWMKIGEIYMGMSIIAERMNIKTSPWASVIESQKHRLSLQKILDSNLIPQFFMRVGYTKKEAPYSPRLTLEEVLEK